MASTTMNSTNSTAGVMLLQYMAAALYLVARIIWADAMSLTEAPFADDRVGYSSMHIKRTCKKLFVNFNLIVQSLNDLKMKQEQRSKGFIGHTNFDRAFGICCDEEGIG